ncbi:periplasmic binding protein-like I [Chytriomyces cf. hyalinus JEL632]|nr:periplasmic binding protein-like I [Chytriomyces cf. hyalinus JEL632]
MPQPTLALLLLLLLFNNHQTNALSTTLKPVNITIASVSTYCSVRYSQFNSSLVTNFSLEYNPSTHNMDDNSGFTYYQDIAIIVALEKANSDPTFLPGIHVNLKRFSDCGEWFPDAAVEYVGLPGGYASAVTAQDIVDVHTDVIGVIGGEYSSTTTGIAEVLSFSQIPYCGTSASSSRFSDKTDYAYFWRMVSVSYANQMLVLLKHWRVTRVAVIVQKDDEFGRSVAGAFKQTMLENSIASTVEVGISFVYDAFALEYLAASLKRSDSRYIIICGQASFASFVVYHAGKAGLVGPEFVWLSVGGVAMNEDPLAVYGPDFYSYIRGVITFGGNLEMNADLYSRINAVAMAELPADAFAYFNVLSAYLCTMTMLSGFAKVLEENSAEDLSARHLQSKMDFNFFRSIRYTDEGANTITLDENGDLDLPISYLTYTGKEFEYVSFGSANLTRGEMTAYNTSVSIFHDGTSRVPVDGPASKMLRLYTLDTLEGRVILILSLFGVIQGIAGFASGILSRRSVAFHVSEAFFCIGSILGYLSLLLSVDTVFESWESCKTRVSLLLTGFVLVHAALNFENAYTIWIYSQRVAVTEVAVARIRAKAAILAVSLVVLEWVLLVIWLKESRYKAVTFESDEFKYLVCAEKKRERVASYYLLLVFNIAVGVVLLVLAHSSKRVIRDVHNRANVLLLTFLICIIGFVLIQAVNASASSETDFRASITVWATITLVFHYTMAVRIIERISKLQLKLQGSSMRFKSQIATARFTTSVPTRFTSSIPSKFSSLRKSAVATSRNCILIVNIRDCAFIEQATWLKPFPHWKSGVIGVYGFRENEKVWFMFDGGSGGKVLCMCFSSATASDTGVVVTGQMVCLAEKKVRVRVEFSSLENAKSFAANCERILQRNDSGE